MVRKHMAAQPAYRVDVSEVLAADRDTLQRVHQR